MQRNVIQYKCCPETYPDVTFTIHIRRRSIFYIYNILFPCMMMSTLTLLGFCLPPGCGEKVSLNLTVLLAFCIFLLNTGEILPNSSEFTSILSEYAKCLCLRARVFVCTGSNRPTGYFNARTISLLYTLYAVERGLFETVGLRCF